MKKNMYLSKVILSESSWTFEDVILANIGFLFFPHRSVIQAVNLSLLSNKFLQKNKK